MGEFQRVFCECPKIYGICFLCESAYGFSFKFYRKKRCGRVDRCGVGGSGARLPELVHQLTIRLCDLEQLPWPLSALMFSKLQKWSYRAAVRMRCEDFMGM